MAEELKQKTNVVNADGKKSDEENSVLDAEETKKTFAVCSNPHCKRPYKKSDKFPNEVCPTCKAEGVKFDKKWLEAKKPRIKKAKEENSEKGGRD